MSNSREFLTGLMLKNVQKSASEPRNQLQEPVRPSPKHDGNRWFDVTFCSGQIPFSDGYDRQKLSQYPYRRTSWPR